MGMIVKHLGTMLAFILPLMPGVLHADAVAETNAKFRAPETLFFLRRPHFPRGSCIRCILGT